MSVAAPTLHYTPKESLLSLQDGKHLQVVDTDRKANNIGALRLLLAWMVILSHSPMYLDGDFHREILTATFHTITIGAVAVRSFFALSGFLIAQSWQSNPVPTHFLRNRILRIYPGFVVACLITVLVFAPLGSGNPVRYLSSISPIRLLYGIVRLGEPHAPPSFPGNRFPHLNGSTWSIYPEFCCYLLILAAGWTSILRRRWFWPPATACVLLAALWLPNHFNAAAKLIGPSLAGLAEVAAPTVLSFFSGVCCFVFRNQIRYTRRGAVLAALVMIPLMFRPWSAILAVATCGTYLLFAAAFAKAPRLRSIGQRADLSYGIYLYASPILQLWVWHYPRMSPWLLNGLTTICSATLALASWHLVEAPALRLRARKPPTHPGASAVDNGCVNGKPVEQAA